MSYPVTVKPASAKRSAVGSPTWPRPTTQTVIFRSSIFLRNLETANDLALCILTVIGELEIQSEILGAERRDGRLELVLAFGSDAQLVALNRRRHFEF